MSSTAPPNVRRVAVIGAGPSGLSAVHALDRENRFDTIRIFERRDRIGGTWIYDAEPDPFPSPTAQTPPKRPIPPNFPSFTSPAPEDATRRTGIYEGLDSNVGSAVMQFTHTPFPEINSAASVTRFGFDNPTRPWRVVAKYLEDLFAPYLHLVTFNTTLEKLEKDGGEWVLTLRQSGKEQHARGEGKVVDFWWQERFDAVVVASGHYTVPLVPDIPGLTEFEKAFPGKLEHSKAFRSADDYVGKRVVVVGGNVSASDLVIDLHRIVKGPLYLSQRGANPKLESVWKLRNLRVVRNIKSLSLEEDGTVEFEDGAKVSNVDKVIFATGYRLSYPFIQPNPVAETNRLTGFYQHVFNIGDPTLTVIGQVRAALSFRVYEYQAVAVARFLAGRATLPSTSEQQGWEKKRVQYKGPTALFHEIASDFKDYFEWLRTFAGPPAEESNGYELPPFEDDWPDLGLAVLGLKVKYVEHLRNLEDEDDQRIKAKL